MMNVRASAKGDAAEDNIGIENVNAVQSVMMNVFASASGGVNSYGIHNTGSQPKMRNVTATAADGTTLNYGIYNFSASNTTMRGVTATAAGAGSYRVYNTTSSPHIQGSYIEGGTGGLNGISVSTRISDTQIVNFFYGDASTDRQCRNVYDENHDDLPC